MVLFIMKYKVWFIDNFESIEIKPVADIKGSVPQTQSLLLSLRLGQPASKNFD
jgi:hypothetical protein